MFRHVFTEFFPRRVFTVVRRTHIPRQVHPALAELSNALPHDGSGVRRALPRNGSRTMPDYYGVGSADDRTNFADAHPQIPVVDAGDAFIEHADSRQAASSKDSSPAGNKISHQ